MMHHNRAFACLGPQLPGVNNAEQSMRGHCWLTATHLKPKYHVVPLHVVPLGHRIGHKTLQKCGFWSTERITL
jgi:hypothetical protein